MRNASKEGLFCISLVQQRLSLLWFITQLQSYSSTGKWSILISGICNWNIQYGFDWIKESIESVASMKRSGFFSRPVSLQHSTLGINDRLVRIDSAVGPNWIEFTVSRSSQWWAWSAVRAQQWTPKQQITMHSHAIAPKWPSRSSHHTGHITNV